MVKEHDSLIYFGGEVKALGGGRVGGQLVRFTHSKDRDITGEWFSTKTYYGPQDGDGADVIFHHGIPLKKGWEKLAAHVFASPVKTKRNEIGLWAETVLNLADEYEKAVYALVEAGKLGWSSGSTARLVRKSPAGEIIRWPIVEASLTFAPAEPRNRAASIKSSDFANMTKGLFADSLQQTENQTYELWDAVRQGTRRIVQAAGVSDITGSKVNVATQVEELVGDFAEALVPAIVSQVTDYLSGNRGGDAGQEFYLRSLSNADDDEFFQPHQPVVLEIKTDWSEQFINELPDSSFAYIEPGGQKDEGLKSLPRSVRHFPYRDAMGNLDEQQVRTQLSRIPSSNISDEAKTQSLALMRRAAKTLGIEVETGKTLTFTEHFLSVVTAVEDHTKTAGALVEDVTTMTQRIRERIEFREAKDGRTLAQAHREHLNAAATNVATTIESLTAIKSSFDELMEASKPKTKTDLELANTPAPEQALAEAARFEELRFNLATRQREINHGNGN